MSVGQDCVQQRTEVCLSLVEKMTYRRLAEIRGEQARYINNRRLGREFGWVCDTCLGYGHIQI